MKKYKLGEGNIKGRIKNVLNYKKAPFWIIIVAVVMAVVVSIGLLTNPKAVSDAQVGPEEPTTQEIIIEPTAPLWYLDQITGVDMVSLDYASDDIIIFHGYFGLYVYDLNKQAIIRSVDLQAINCARTQGDDYCEVAVSMDGNTVQLHPMSSEEMYVYNVSGHTLKKMAYELMEKPFWENFVFIEDVYSKLNRPGGMGAYSYNVAEFKDNEYGYLYSEDETLGTLSYRRGDKVYNLFAGKDTVSPTSIVITYTNPTDKEVLYGQSHILEQLNGMVWINIPLKPNVGWEDIRNGLDSNRSVEERSDLLFHIPLG